MTSTLPLRMRWLLLFLLRWSNDMRYRVDAYQGSEFHGGFTEAHFFPTVEDAVLAWIEVGWSYEHPDAGLEDWNATEALLSETALVIDQETAQIARVLSYEASQDSRLPIAVVRDRHGRELSRIAVEDMAVA